MKSAIHKSIFISLITKRNIKEDYEFLQELGSGAYGVVFKAKNNITGDFRAVKAIAKDRIQDSESFSSEITILKSLDHPNIIRLYEVYESESTVYLVTDICEGGELFYYITAQKYLSEDDAAKIMRQIFSAVAYCHENNICHRDLKPENFLLKYKNDPNSIKLIDFGLSKKLKENEIMTQPNGTPFYLAPEIIKGQYSKEVDNWSVGVILYILLCGSPPFYGKTTKDIIQAIKKGVYTLSYKPFISCSIEVKDLIAKLLVKDPSKRYSAIQAYNHPWIKRKVDLESENLLIEENTIKNISKIIEFQFLKKTILLYIASYIPESEVEEFKKVFLKLDTNGNGLLSKEEMVQGLEEFNEKFKMKLSKDEISKIFDAMDLDKSGQIDYSEFIACFVDNVLFKNEKYLTQAFKKIDLDKSEKISMSELKSLLNTHTFSFNGLDLNDIMNQGDLDKDGFIDYNEFLKLMRDTNENKRRNEKKSSEKEEEEKKNDNENEE